MIRSKFSVNMRNKLAQMAMECDSAAAINEAKMTSNERETLQKKLRELRDYIDARILK